MVVDIEFDLTVVGIEFDLTVVGIEFDLLIVVGIKTNLVLQDIVEDSFVVVAGIQFGLSRIAAVEDYLAESDQFRFADTFDTAVDFAGNLHSLEV